jgi:hypothetical protein
MIYLTKGQTNQIVLTLKEKQTLPSPNYLFRFVHRALNTEARFVVLNTADTSAYKDRFNQFSLVTNNYFSDKESGEWEYYIYEQNSSSNVDPAFATGLLETGIMRLTDDTSFSYTKYQTSNTFITR